MLCSSLDQLILLSQPKRIMMYNSFWKTRSMDDGKAREPVSED
jgi:hypothetical protein